MLRSNPVQHLAAKERKPSFVERPRDQLGAEPAIHLLPVTVEAKAKNRGVIVELAELAARGSDDR